jgi:hypothetical protein
MAKRQKDVRGLGKLEKDYLISRWQVRSVSACWLTLQTMIDRRHFPITFAYLLDYERELDEWLEKSGRPTS